MNAPTELAIELPNALVQRIERINREYLQLVKEICELDPCAPSLLGLSTELVDILQQVKMSTLCKLSRCGYLVPVLSIKDPAFWERAAEGRTSEADILEQFIVRMSCQ